MKIGFFGTQDWEQKYLEPKLKHLPLEVSFYSHPLDENNLPSKKDFEIISVFVGSRINSKVLDHFPSLKYITTRSTGFDHIDLKSCKERGILVSNVPRYGANTVAEFTFGLILNLTRKIYHAIDQIKEIESFSLENLRGTDLKGKTLGVIGTGSIGKEVIKIAKGFGMKVLASDPYPDLEFAKEQGFEYVSLEKLLQNSDIITIHCPLTDQTKHLINKENIKLIKKGAYLINTARGPIVDTEALILALKEGRLAGAGLDVLEGEKETKEELGLLTSQELKKDTLKVLLENHILMKMPNVLITPHTAFNSWEALYRILDTTLENLKSFLEGKPINLVS